MVKKVWESVSTLSRLTASRSSSTSSCPVRIGLKRTEEHYWDLGSTSGGPFDRVPIDLLMQIFRLLGPKDVAKLSVVCKYLRILASDNRLWMFFLQNQHPEFSTDSVFFSETRLSLAYPLHPTPRLTPQLSFMLIYSQRAQVPGCVVVDGGSGYCKYGWSKYNSPSGRSATFLEFGNIETPLISRIHNFYATIFSRMQVKPSGQPIIVSIPICHYDDTESAEAARRQLKDAIYSALFDLKVPAVCAIDQASLALFAAKQTSGIVVNIGFQQTSIVPILHGKVMRKVGVEFVGVGGLKLTGFLKELMQYSNIDFHSLYTVRTLKEKLCYVAFDYESELSKDTNASFETSEGWFTLGKERFKTGEILFNPRISGVHAMGLHQAVGLCMEHCHAAELAADDDWFKTIVLAGGSACLPGLAERLEKELCELLPSCIANGIRVLPPAYGVDSAWFGAKLISNMSTFPGPMSSGPSWCMTKKQFQQKSRRHQFVPPW